MKSADAKGFVSAGRGSFFKGVLVINKVKCVNQLAMQGGHDSSLATASWCSQEVGAEGFGSITHSGVAGFQACGTLPC